tara:strand:+ start:526 stop:840 length:315 start_codon:yes stop_codon:yes gene_type:complete
MKHTPSAISIEMATHTDVYSVRPQYSNKRKFLEECAIDGKVDRSNIYSNFSQWALASSDARVFGYGIYSGGKLWQMSEKAQRSAYNLTRAEFQFDIEKDEIDDE